MEAELLQNVIIKGFKSIRKLDLDLAPFNVLIGANGAGKSNFISFFRMLSFMFGATAGNLRGYVAAEGPASHLLHYGPAMSPVLSASLKFVKRSDGDFAGDAWSEYSFDLTFGQGARNEGDKLFYSGERWRFKSLGKDAPIERALGSGHEESMVLNNAIHSQEHAYQKEAKLFTERLRQLRVYHFHNTSREAHIRLDQDMTRSGNYLMSDAGNLWVFLHKIKEYKPAHYNRILSTVQLVAPFIRDLILEPSKFNPRSLAMGWLDRSNQEFGPYQLSDGTLRAIALITALLQPEENMPSIMLFDEPELGLHPAAIGLVASLLKAVSLKRQVIVATQSPILIREYKPEDIIVMERRENQKGDGESYFTRLNKEDLGNWLDRFDLGKLYEMNVTGGGAQ